jgi:hypothetical protein
MAQKGGRRPILILTKNGEVVVKIVGPKGATDVHVLWGGSGVPEGGGYGYWTKNHQEIPKSRFQFGSDINDIHFSTTGRVPRLPPIPAPPESNDVEIGWEEDGRITEAWWTKDGQQLAAIPVTGDAQELNLKFNRQGGQNTQGTATTQLIGLVYDKDVRPGDQAIMSLTNDPRKYEKLPGLGVIEMKVPTKAGEATRDVLNGFVLDPANHRQQEATKPLAIQLAQSVTSLPIKLTAQHEPDTDSYNYVIEVPEGKIIGGEWINEDRSHHPDFVWLLTQTNIPVQNPNSTTMVNTGAPSDFVTPPVCQDTSFVRGPFSGGGSLPNIMVDDRTAPIVAGSSTTSFFDLPSEAQSGAHQLVVQYGQRVVTFPIVRLGIIGHIDQPTLRRGQKTNYSVTVNLGSLPETVWRNGGGVSPELINLSQVQTMAPSFKPPQTGEPAVVLLAVNNASRETVSINPSKDQRVVLALHQSDFQNDQYTTRGEVQSRVTGAFTIDLLTQGFFAPIGGQPLALGLLPRICPNRCPKPDPQPPGETEVTYTPHGYGAGEVDKMKSGVQIISNAPMPGPGKAIQAAAAALIEGAFGFAEKSAKKTGVTIWVRVSCYVCQEELCLGVFNRKNWVKYYSPWEKVMDLDELSKTAGVTSEGTTLSTDQIAEAIKAKADALHCP